MNTYCRSAAHYFLARASLGPYLSNWQILVRALLCFWLTKSVHQNYKKCASELEKLCIRTTQLWIRPRKIVYPTYKRSASNLYVCNCAIIDIIITCIPNKQHYDTRTSANSSAVNWSHDFRLYHVTTMSFMYRLTPEILRFQSIPPFIFLLQSL